MNASTCTLKAGGAGSQGVTNEKSKLMDIFSYLIPSLPHFLVFNREGRPFPHLLGVVKDPEVELGEH